MEVKIRKSFSFLPGIVWAILIDATDLILGLIPFLEVVGDFIQLLIAITIFEDIRVPIMGFTDVLLPPPLDFFPSYTAAYLIVESGKV